MQNQQSQEIIRRQEERKEEIKQQAIERKQNQDAMIIRIAAMFPQRLLMTISIATPDHPQAQEAPITSRSKKTRDSSPEAHQLVLHPP